MTDANQALDRYRIKRELARGGMGVVYLAYDTVCKRYIALKKIRDDVKDHKGAVSRFLREAYITSSLTHSSIVPIYSIHELGQESFYTMPYLEGMSLRQALLQARENPYSMPIAKACSLFQSVSRAIAHAHACGIIHRDIKADNIWLLRGEDVVILDWGVAKDLSTAGDIDDVRDCQDYGSIDHSRIVGTLNYMSPERIQRQAANFASDIYSLGVLFYFMLSLKLPFHRKDFRTCRRNLHRERYIPPQLRAPFREIPRALVDIVQRAMSPNPEMRYCSVESLLSDLQTFQEKRSQWQFHTYFGPFREGDWIEKQWMEVPIKIENSEGRRVKIGAATRMRSRFSLDGNFRIIVHVHPQEDAQGVLLHFDPQAWSGQKAELSGVALWLSGDRNIPGALIRDGVTILSLPEFFLSAEREHHLVIENNEHTLVIYFDHHPKVTYVSCVPLVSMPLTLWVCPGHFQRFDCEAFGGQLRLEVSCLELPDYLFAQGRFTESIDHYSHISEAFIDYSQGRHARYRSGLAWIEISRRQEYVSEGVKPLDEAIKCFEGLKDTVSAPLEWLGKSLVYRQRGLYLDEAKALEMACVRYVDHPLLKRIDEEIIFRLYQSSQDRLEMSCQLILAICRSRSCLLQRREIQVLIHHVLDQLCPLEFWQSRHPPVHKDTTFKRWTVSGLALRMAFYLSDEVAIVALVQQILSFAHLQHSDLEEKQRLWFNALFCLAHMQAYSSLRTLWHEGLECLQLSEHVRALSYEIICPCGTFWLQSRFALDLSEQKVWSWSLLEALRRDHVQMYKLLHLVLRNCMSNSFEKPQKPLSLSTLKCLQDGVLSHLYYKDSTSALELFENAQGHSSKKFNIFIRAICALADERVDLAMSLFKELSESNSSVDDEPYCILAQLIVDAPKSLERMKEFKKRVVVFDLQALRFLILLVDKYACFDHLAVLLQAIPTTLVRFP